MLKNSFWVDFYVILIVELFYDLDLIKNSNQENVCIRNIQCLLEKNVLNTKYVYYSQGSAREPNISFLCLINERTIWSPSSPGCFFLWTRVDVLLDSLRKTNLEHKEICASDWLKPPISKLRNHVFFRFFYVLHSRFGFASQEAYLQFKHK